MKVFMILCGKSLNGGGGAERRFLRLFEKIKKESDIDLKLIINKQLYESARELGILANDRKVYIYQENSILKEKIFFLFVISMILKEKPDIIHLILIQKSLVPLYIFLCLFKKLLKIKVVGTVASYLYAKEINLTKFEKLVYKIFIKSSDFIDSLYPSIKLKYSNLRISPCSFTDYNKFQSREKENIIVFAGRLINEKNPFLFIQSINKMINIYHDDKAKKWKYYIMGNGPLKEELIKYVQQKKLEKYIYFGEGDISNILSISKIFVSLQQFENYPSQAILEAIASKNYIVATDVGDTRKFLDDDYSSLVKCDVDSLSNCLLKLIDVQDFDSKVEMALKITRQNHNIERFMNYIIELWEDVIKF